MNFQQLKIIRETARLDFNLTEVAMRLHTSQPGVSKHIKDLEEELGVELYIRKGKRLLGLTEPGKEVLKIAERMLLDAGNLKNLGQRYSAEDAGRLTLATTHTQARYRLPAVVQAFKKHYPKVHLKLHQGSPQEIAQMLLAGEADIGIATETLGDTPALAAFPLYRWYHSVVVPEGHALTQLNKITLEAIAEHPIITYHDGFTGSARVIKAFQDAGLEPDIVLSAMDSDVIKDYVELGFGIGIMADFAFNPVKDTHLTLLSGHHLFSGNQTRIALRRGVLLRQFAYYFIHLLSPELTEDILLQKLSEDFSL